MVSDRMPVCLSVPGCQPNSSRLNHCGNGSQSITLQPIIHMNESPLFRPGFKSQNYEVRLGANVRINALTVWRVFQSAMPRLHATSKAKSISGAMATPQFRLPLLPECQLITSPFDKPCYISIMAPGAPSTKQR